MHVGIIAAGRNPRDELNRHYEAGSEMKYALIGEVYKETGPGIMVIGAWCSSSYHSYCPSCELFLVITGVAVPDGV